jgi:CRP/FNR family transcriptional regulator, nitrogen fixation regulation protein
MLQIAGAHSDLKAPGGKQTLWSDFTYRRNNEIFGEAEPADYVYQITSGAGRTFKLLSDGRRQIGAFHLPGDIQRTLNLLYIALRKFKCWSL